MSIVSHIPWQFATGLNVAFKLVDSHQCACKGETPDASAKMPTRFPQDHETQEPPDAWYFRFYMDENGKKVYKRMFVGSVIEFPKRKDAERAVQQLRVSAVTGMALRVSQPIANSWGTLKTAPFVD